LQLRRLPRVDEIRGVNATLLMEDRARLEAQKKAARREEKVRRRAENS
jgi:hypothetical protein